MPSRRKAMKKRDARHTYKQTIIQQIQSGEGLKGLRINRKGNIELDYHAFKDTFRSKADFTKYFSDIIKASVPLKQKVHTVKKALSHFQVRHEQEATAFKGHLSSYRMHHFSAQKYCDFDRLFRELRSNVMTLLEEKNYRGDWSMNMWIRMKKINDPEKKAELLFVSPNMRTINKAEAATAYEKLASRLYKWLENRGDTDGSGWVPDRILSVYLNIAAYNHIKAKGHFVIPGHTTHSGLLNIKNQDQYCLLWCITAALHPTNCKNKNDTKYYSKCFKQYLSQIDKTQFEDKEDFDYGYFEHFFQCGLFIYQLILDTDDEIVPIYRPSLHDDGQNLYPDRTIHLLKAIRFNEEGQAESHFVLVTNVERMLRRQLWTNHHTSKLHMCTKCMARFPSPQERDRHIANNCVFTPLLKGPKMRDDEEHPILRFTGQRKQIPVPIVGYADFEALVIPTHQKKGEKGIITSYQETCSWAFTLIFNQEKELHFQLKLKQEEDKSVVVSFMDAIKEKLDELYEEYIAVNEPMKMDKKDWKIFDAADQCVICKKPGDWVEWDKECKPNIYSKVRHHNHNDGKFIGAAHSKCNLETSKLPNVTILFHNFTGYDSHHIITNLSASKEDWYGLVGDNSERIKCLRVYRQVPKHKDQDQKYWKRYTLRFIDSLAFKKDSLENLTKSLYDFDEEKKNQGHGLAHNLPYTTRYMDQACQDNNPLEMMLKKKLILGKNAYPYEYLDCLDKFHDALFNADGKFLLEPKHFVSSLREGQQPIVERCKHVEAVCRAFGFTTFEQYHNLYLTLDVYNLTDVFELYRKTCLGASNCGLDPAHFFGIPSLAYNSAMAQLDEVVEIIADPDEYLRLREEGMRGGISCWMQYYDQANNEMHPDYDPTQPKSYILDEDATSLYPDAARMFLPVGDYKWVDDVNLTGDAMWEMIDKWIVQNDHGKGCYFWVDIHLPMDVEEWNRAVPSFYRKAESAITRLFDGDLHDYNADYPPLVEKKAIPTDWLSEGQQQVYQETGGHKPTEKLICDLMPKERYMIHYLTLRQAMECGWVPTKIHNMFTFRQGQPLKSFMDNCIELRSQSKNAEEKSLQKNIMNSMIGKTIEDVMKHSDYRLFTTYRGFRIAQTQERLKPNWKILNNQNLVMGECYKKEVLLDKPITLGIAVYDNSKIRMCQLCYLLKQYFGRRFRVLGTDTDSLIIHVETDNWEEDMTNLNRLAMFPDDHPYSKISRFSDKKTKELIDKGINPYIGIFDRGESYLKSVPGWYKLDQDNVIEVCAMRAKQYSFLIKSDEVMWLSYEKGQWFHQPIFEADLCKSKGTPKAYVNSRYTHQLYKDMVLGTDPVERSKKLEATFNGFRSLKHIVSTINMTKTSLRAVDDKRYALKDGIHTLPFGHHAILKKN